MPKVKIINSYSLECLTSVILCEIEQADSQIRSYEDELEGEKNHRQNEKSIDRISRSRDDWILRRDFLHQCLCKIKMQIKEIEI